MPLYITYDLDTSRAIASGFIDDIANATLYGNQAALEVESIPLNLNRYKVVDGGLVQRTDYDAREIEAARSDALRQIDDSAGTIRKLFITDVPGQDMVYQRKSEEAQMVTADPSINPAEVPHIAVEAQLNQETLLDSAGVILTMEQQWVQLSAVIEGRRLGAKAAVTAATTYEEIVTAANIDWSDLMVYVQSFTATS